MGPLGRSAVCVVVGALAVAACSGGGEERSIEPTVAANETVPSVVDAASTTVPAASENPLSDVRLATDLAEQLDPIRLLGLDLAAIDVTGLLATYEIADGNWWASPVVVDADGPFIVAPLTPNDPEIGGEFELYLSDGTHTGPPLTLTVTAMPEAPGAFEDAIEALATGVGEVAASLGSSWDELAETDPTDTSPELAMLKLAQLLLDDGTGTSAAGAYAGLAPADAALVDSIFAKLDMPSAVGRDRFETLAAYLPEQVTPSSDGSTAEDGSGDVAGFAPPARRDVASAPRQGAACIPFYAEGGGQVSAARLSEMMIGAAMGDIAVNPNSTPGRTFAALEVTLTLGSVLEAGATGGKGKVYDTVGKAAGGWKMYNSMLAGLMPSSFTRIEVELDPGDLEEDRPESSPGTWPSVKVWAASTGYSLDGDIAGELAGSLGGDFVKTRLPGDAADVPEDAVDWFHKLDDAVDVSDINDAAGAEPIKNAVNEMLPEEGVITFCAQEFTADVAGSDWSWARPVRALLTVDNDAQTYVNTTEIGSDTLAIGPLPSKFGQRSIYAQKPVETEAIDVRIEPDVIWVNAPGEPAEITATIEHAFDPKLGWYADQGEWASGGGAVETDGGATQVLTTPSNADAFGDDGIRVEVESLSRTGLRVDGEPPRYDFVMVKLAPFTVIPDPGNVLTEEQIEFSAVDREGKALPVVWSATGGSITSGPAPTAVYTAGRDAGTYTVTARLPDNPGVEVTVTVNVSDPECIFGNWELDVPRFVDAMNRFADSGGVTYLSGRSQVIVRETGVSTWIMDNVRLSMTQEGQTFTLVWNSTVDNGFSLEGGVYAGEGGTADFSILVEEFGRAVTMTVPSAVGGTATFDCEPRESLVIQTEDGDLFLTWNGPA